MLLLPLIWVGCSSEERESFGPEDDARVSFTVDMPEFSTMRAVDENTINTLELWVFNENGLFLQRSVAQKEATTNRFTVNINRSDKSRSIHFIANYTLTNPENWIGKDEKEMLPALNVQGEEIRMWAHKTYPAVTAGQDLGTIALLRNKVKFELVVNTPKLAGATFALYQTWDKGTLSPFDPHTGEFTEGTVTEPAGVAFTESSFVSPGTPLYGYERKNASPANRKISCLIVKARYNGSGQDSYYKIDFVRSADKKRYDLIRNHLYKVKINEVWTEGYNTLEGALNGAAANNISLSEEVQLYPSFSDGKGRLEAEKTEFLFTNGEANASFQVDYYPDQNSNVKANDRIVVNHSGNAISNAQVDAMGKVTMQLNTPGFEALKSELVISVNDNPELKRLVKIHVRKKFDYREFSANSTQAVNHRVNVNVQAGQGESLKVDIKFPVEFHQAYLPIRIRFYTENFYPSKPEGLIFGIEGGKVFYECLFTHMPDSQSFSRSFKSNKVASAETISVKNLDGYFSDYEIVVNN